MSGETPTSETRPSFPFEIFPEAGFHLFLENFIEKNRGKSLLLLKIQKLAGITVEAFVKFLLEQFWTLREKVALGDDSEFYISGNRKDLYIGTSQCHKLFQENSTLFLALLGKIHDHYLVNSEVTFNFGIGRTQANFVSNCDEIFDEIDKHAQRSLEDNIRRKNWVSLNKVNNYFAVKDIDAVIQPMIQYNPRKKTFSVSGGEVFVGGTQYKDYYELMRDIPSTQDAIRIDLLILEKLITSCHHAPGILKFNVTPQTLIDTFDTMEKVERFSQLVTQEGLKVENVRLELVEKPYEETKQRLLEVCQKFSAVGISFAADDFGMKSQGHQLVLELGELIKEFKLDPISFKFRVEDDHTKFLDNLAFLQYCKHLANNRDAIITAEALEDIDALDFLLGHQVYHFQANIFCGKIPIGEYISEFSQMQEFPAENIYEVLHSKEKSAQLLECRNIFRIAQRP